MIPRAELLVNICRVLRKPSPDTASLFAAVLASFGVCWFVLLSRRAHEKLSVDDTIPGLQKVHKTPVPRIGGFGILAIDLIAAARPNFMKVAPLYKALAQSNWCKPRLVHTGQHYDANMSDAFFADLGLPEPVAHLGVGSGTHAEQTGGVMIAYEKECLRNRPDWVIVVGDVNSTVACTLAAAKLGIKVAHRESGLRPTRTRT